MRDTVKKKKKKTVGQANAVGAGSRKAYRRKKTAIVAAITLIYLVIVAAAAVIIDDRHVEITLLGDEEHEPLHILRPAGKLPAQLRILGRDAEGAGAQMAYPHHPAAHGHQRRRRKSKLLRA